MACGYTHLLFHISSACPLFLFIMSSPILNSFYLHLFAILITIFLRFLFALSLTSSINLCICVLLSLCGIVCTALKSVINNSIAFIQIQRSHYYLHMNKQLERDLQSFIQSLKSPQLANVMAHYEELTNIKCNKNFAKKGMNYQCEINYKSQTARGYGRNQEQSLSNATKNLLSGLISKNIDIDKITQSLKFKNGSCQQQKVTKQELPSEKEFSLILDDISMIQSNQRLDRINSECKERKNNCDCMYYEMHQYQQSEIKHLQARVNLLSEENQLLKKMLLCTPQRASQLCIDKQNDSFYSNSNYSEKKKII